jgi:teichuronic acid biosynthesis glycosyltransferase TuaG
MQYEVVITAFNRYTELEETLKGIVNQTLRPLAIHLVIDGSDDTIKNIGEKYSCKVYHLNHSGRPAIGRNFGWSKCSADFIAFCDDDDVWLPDKMQSQIRYLIENKDVDILCTRALLWDGKRVIGLVNRFSGRVSILNLVYRNSCVFSSLVIRNNRKIKKFPVANFYKAWEDYYFLIENCILDFKMYVLGEEKIYYRINTHNKISKKFDSKRDLYQFREIFKLLIKNKKISIFIFIPIFAFRIIRSKILD